MLALGLPKKPPLFHFFSSLSENVSKWVPKWEGEKVQKIVFFLIVELLGVTRWAWASFSHPGHNFGTLFGCPWVHFCWILKSLGIILAPLAPAKNVICSCVRCIMQHSRNRSRTTREPKIQCKRILKPTWQGSFLLNFEFHEYHFGTLAKCNLFLCPLHHAAQ